MLKNNKYMGLTLDGNTIRVTHLKYAEGILHLQKLDEFTLVEPLEEGEADESADVVEPIPQEEEQQQASDDVFGFERSAEERNAPKNGDESDVDFEELEEKARKSELQAVDMVSESTDSGSNAILLYDILSHFDENKAQVGLNVPAGDTIFQIIRDTDFNEVKRKDLVEDLEAKLESIYDEVKSTDHYSYFIREDGSLVLASVREEAPLLTVLNETKDYYTGKLRVRAVYPDEIGLAAMVKANYQLESEEITGVLQFGADRCRLFFMQGEEILYVAPTITDGTKNENILDTVFSKILFELDSGKVPGIDQIIIANNTIGEEAVNYYDRNFPNIEVQNLQYDPEMLETSDIEPSALRSFTTAIAMGWAAAKTHEEIFPELSFLPAYVKDRQEIFKLKWHGMLLLCLVFFAPITFNFFYQQNSERLQSLNNELKLVNTRIEQITPVVERTRQISQDLALITSKLALLDSLSSGSKAWSAKFDIINKGMNGIANAWYTSMTKTQEGTFVEGYTLYRNRIPAIVDIYAEATLLNVSIDEIRQEEIFRFSILVKQFAKDSTVYSPEKPENIRRILSE